MSFLSESHLGDKFGPFVAFQEALGFVPNLFRAQTLLPRVIEAQAELESAGRLREGPISRLQKERILLIVAADRQDTYCVAAGNRVLSSFGVSDCQIDDLLNNCGGASLSAADLACQQFCLKLSRDAPSVHSDDIQALRAYGFEDRSILEIVFVTALAVYRGSLSVGLGPEPDFGPRKITSRRVDSPHAVAFHELLTDSHGAAQRKGPHLPAPYLSSETFSILQKSHGFIPNFFRSQTLRPGLLEAELEAVERIPKNVLTRAQKECILLAVSAANLNSYCVAMHCDLLRGLGMSAEEGDQVAVDYRLSSLSEADRALLDFAVKLGVRFSQFSRSDIVNLRTFGFTEEQILECEVVVALNNFANTLQMGLGIEPDFEPPLVLGQNKVHLSVAARRPMGRGLVAPSLTGVEDPDARLLAQAQGGKLEAFEELVRRHSQSIYRALVAVLGDPVEAQDAMQDTLLSAFKHIAGFQSRSKFSTWLVSIARNSAFQRLRGRKEVESLDEGEYEYAGDPRPRQVKAWQDNPEQCYSKSEIRQLVERGILGLPAMYRAVAMLPDIEPTSVGGARP
jgi:RNA polymerase sigma-70 factor (ECF subfamily)